MLCSLIRVCSPISWLGARYIGKLSILGTQTPLVKSCTSSTTKICRGHWNPKRRSQWKADFPLLQSNWSYSPWTSDKFSAHLVWQPKPLCLLCSAAHLDGFFILLHAQLSGVSCPVHIPAHAHVEQFCSQQSICEQKSEMCGNRNRNMVQPSKLCSKAL